MKRSPLQITVLVVKIIIAVIFIAAIAFYSVLNAGLFSLEDKGEREYFAEETVYTFIDGNAVGNAIGGYIEKEYSTIVFRPDGTMTMTITPSPMVLVTANIYLIENHDDIAGISLSDMERYTNEVLPGESFFSFVSALQRLGSSLGFNVNGFDFEDEEVMAIFDEFKKTHEIPEDFLLPKEFNVTIETTYSLCTVPSDSQEGGYKAIYLGDYKSVKEDPFFILTRYVDKKGREALYITNEMLSLRLDFAIL